MRGKARFYAPGLISLGLVGVLLLYTNASTPNNCGSDYQKLVISKPSSSSAAEIVNVSQGDRLVVEFKDTSSSSYKFSLDAASEVYGDFGINTSTTIPTGFRQGCFVASPGSVGVTAVLKIINTADTTKKVTIKVKLVPPPPLELSPATAEVGFSGVIALNVRKPNFGQRTGLPPYRFEVPAGEGTIYQANGYDGFATFTAPSRPVEATVTVTDSSNPVQTDTSKITVYPEFKKVVQGPNFTIALRGSDGTLWAWGLNTSGELGIGRKILPGTTIPPGCKVGRILIDGSFADAIVECDTPVQIPNLTGVTDVAARWNSACAIRSNASLWCWGNNENSSFTNFTTMGLPDPDGAGTEIYEIPTQVTGLESYLLQDIEAGNQGICVIYSPATAPEQRNVKCVGRPGISASAWTDLDTSIAVGVRSLALGDYNGCFVKSNGDLYCWGNDQNQQLGDGNPAVTNSSKPVLVAGGRKFTAVAGPGSASSAHNSFCAISDTRNVFCWGGNGGSSGSLGIGTAWRTDIPCLPNSPTNPTSIKDCYAPVGIQVENVRSLSYGGTTSCLVTYDNLAYCWGSDGYAGQTGNGPGPVNSPFLSPLVKDHLFTPLGEVGSISVLREHGCASTAAGLYCWGSNESGSLGIGDVANVPKTEYCPNDGLGMTGCAYAIHVHQQ